jgi:hypothetical protein
LDFKALVVSTGTSHAWRHLALQRQPLLWPQLVARAYSPWSVPLRAEPATFTARKSERWARLDQEASSWARERQRERLLFKRTAATRALDLFHIRLLAPATGLALLLLVAFMALEMDGQVQEWPSSAVLSPAWAVLCLLALALATGRLAWKHRVLQDEAGELVFLFHCQEVCLLRCRSFCNSRHFTPAAAFS